MRSKSVPLHTLDQLIHLVVSRLKTPNAKNGRVHLRVHTRILYMGRCFAATEENLPYGDIYSIFMLEFA